MAAPETSTAIISKGFPIFLPGNPGLIIPGSGCQYYAVDISHAAICH